MVLSFVIPAITKFEKSTTGTAYDCSVALKLSLSLFLNSGIIPIITYKEDTYFTDGGFLMSVWLNWLCIAVLSPILELFSVQYLLSVLFYRTLKSRATKSLMTQREANIESEPISPNLYLLCTNSLHMGLVSKSRHSLRLAPFL